MINVLLSTFPASALLFPFMILFFKQQLGLTTTECAVIYGCLPLFSAFFNLLIGAIADKFQIHKVLTLVFCILSAVLLNCLLFVPPKEGTTNIEPKGDTTHFVTCIQHSNASIQCTMINDKDTINGNSNMSHRQDLKSNYSLKDCGSVWNISSEAICSQHTSFRQTIPVETTNLMEVQKCKVNCLLTQDNLKATTFGQTFWISFFLYFTSASIFNAIWVVLYGMLFAILGDNRNDFGKTRIWASIGGLLTSVIVAFTMNRYGSSSSDMSFIPCFIGYGVGLLLAGVASMFFKLPQIPSNPAMIKDIIKLFRQPRIALLFTVVFILGFLHGGVEIFLFVFLRELDASSWALGGCFFARFLGEIVAMYHSGMVIERVGHIRCIYMFLAFLCLRCLGTSLIPNPWWELPLSFTRSIAYSIGYAALSVYGSLVTPPSMHATLQGVILTVYYGFGKLCTTHS